MTIHPPPPEPGLCHSCTWARRAGNARGSDFLLCDLSRTDPLFARYPRLPVLACSGYSDKNPGQGTEATQNSPGD